MKLLVAWLALSVLVAAIADTKGRSAIAFFVLSLFLSPLIGLIAVLITKRSAV
jgi:hypothetical protein